LLNDDTDYLRDQSSGLRSEEVLHGVSLEGIDKGCRHASMYEDQEGRETATLVQELGDERDHEAGG
jgi:hypothetical protein